MQNSINGFKALVEIFGKDRLGDLGFCLNRQKFNESDSYVKILENLLKITEDVSIYGRRIIMTSLTPLQDIEYQKGDYIPTVIRYSKAYQVVYNPFEMVKKKRSGMSIPTADFICWTEREQKDDELCFATFSRTAPILYFESENGQHALGTVLKNTILKNGSYIISRIKKELVGDSHNKIKSCIITSTDYVYGGGTIEEQLKSTMAEARIEYRGLLYGTSAHSKCLYQHEEIGNHVVVIS